MRISFITVAAALSATLPAVTLAAAPAAAQEFQSPSRNIACVFYTPEAGFPGHAVRCDIARFTPSHHRPPPDCNLDWRGIFWLDETGRGQQGCAGDVGATPAAPVLGYGSAMQSGGIRCRSESKGMTCTNAEGHGFFISRGQQRLF